MLFFLTLFLMITAGRAGMASLPASTECPGGDGIACARDGTSNFHINRLAVRADGRIAGTMVTNLCANHPWGSTTMGTMSGGGHQSDCSEITFPLNRYVSQSGAVAAPLRGALGYSVSGGISVYGPMEAGFVLGQACSNGLGECPGGLEVPVCEHLLEQQCGAPNVRYSILLDTCEGHATPYHYHKDLACDYNASSSGPHSPLIAVAMDGRGIYGLWEGDGEAPTDLDACGGHVGDVPAYSTELPARQEVYHYHTQEKSPYTLGCYGPVADLEACKALYPACSAAGTSFTTSRGPITYTLDCPCFRDQHGATFNVYNATSATPTTTTPTTPATSQKKKKNVLLIIADDMGAYEFDFLAPDEASVDMAPTPNIHALASTGVTFENAYSEPVCSASRAAMLTGLHPHKTGVGTVGATSGTLSGAFETLPQVISANAPEIASASFGKWHLGGAESAPNVVGGWPHYRGVTGNLDDYYSYQEVENGVTQATSTVYETTQITDNAIAWVSTQRAQQKQFFAWVAYHAPHAPFQKPPDSLHSYDALADGEGRGAQARPYYKAMVEAMDTEIGRLLASVNHSETTVIFVADNGSPTLSKPAFVPESKAKGTLFEGGVNVPLVVAGAQVAGAPRKEPSLVHIVDLHDTVLDLLGVSRPATPQKDSQSFFPNLLASPSSAPAPSSVMVELFGPTMASTAQHHGRGVRNAEYKVIRTETRGLELFHLPSDPWEATNLLQAPPLSMPAEAAYAFLLNELLSVYPAPDATFGFSTPAPVLPLAQTEAPSTSTPTASPTASAPTLTPSQAPTATPDLSRASAVGSLPFRPLMIFLLLILRL